MKKSKTIATVFFSAVSVFSMLTLCSINAFSQMEQTTAQLNVTGKTMEGGATPFITVNGQNSLNDSRLMSPAAVTVPAETTAVINLGNAGQIELSPGTVANITFNGNAVVVSLTGGRLRATSPANADFKVETADGIILNDKTQQTIFIAEIIGGATGVSTETGIAKVNGVPLKAGKVWTSDPKLKSKFLAANSTNKRIGSNKKRTFWRYAIASAAGVGVGAIILLAGRR